MSNQCSKCGMINPPQARFCNACGAPLAFAAAVMPIGTGMLPPQTMLANRYIIVRCVGQGGMGAVYEGVDTRIPGKKWAIKEMSDAAITDPLEKQQAISLFRQEARLLASLVHPNLPRVPDYFSERGKQYLVMEFVEGQNLEEVLAGAAKPIDEKQVIEWGKQLCSVLGYLHNHNPPIIFRDLKPLNIMLDGSGNIKLIDFGLARLFKPGRVQDTAIAGTFGYAPPEQYGTGQTDARSDIYSLGVVLHHLVTGYEPSQNPLKSPPPARHFNRAVSTEFEKIIAKATRQKREARYQSMAEMKLALEAVSGISASSPKTVFKKDCPGCVSIIAILSWISAMGLGIMGGLALLVSIGGSSSGSDAGATAMMGIFMILGGFISYRIAKALWQLEAWIWWVIMLLLAASLLALVFLALPITDSGEVVILIVGALVLIGWLNLKKSFG